MPFYLKSPSYEDRIFIFLSHQPSSDNHKLTMQGRESVVKKLMEKGLNQRDWPDGAAKHITMPRFIIGGDLNTTASNLRMLAGACTAASVHVATSKANLLECKSGDVALGINLMLVQEPCVVKGREAQHDIVLAKFSWPSIKLPASLANGAWKHHAHGVWTNRRAQCSSSSPLAPTSGATEHIAASATEVSSTSSIPAAPGTGTTEHPAVSSTGAASNNSNLAVPNLPDDSEDDDQDKSEPPAVSAAQISDDESWQIALTLMMLY